jgi:co-chaperonin GroES (HSP10)
MRVLGDKILCKPVDRNEVKVGSIVVPTIAIKDSYMGEVVEVGPEAVDLVKPGEFIVAPVHYAIEIQVHQQDYYVYSAKHVSVVLTREEVFGT